MRVRNLTAVLLTSVVVLGFTRVAAATPISVTLSGASNVLDTRINWAWGNYNDSTNEVIGRPTH